MSAAHREFTREQRKAEKQIHKNMRVNQPYIFEGKKQELLKAIVDAKEVNLNISKVHITPSLV